MGQSEFDGMPNEQLGERLRYLKRAYDEACLAYDATKSKELHGQLRQVEQEFRVRNGGDWGCTGFEELDLDQLVERFKTLAIEYDEAEEPPEAERIYWELDKLRNELERRDGDQRRALILLYMHPDIRIRAAAADATRAIASHLSRDRSYAIDDPDWSPPISVTGMSEANLDALFPNRSKTPKQSKLKAMSIDQLVERFVAIAVEEDDAHLAWQVALLNRLFWQLAAVQEELKSRDGDQRRVLVALYDHPNMQVRLKAAKATLAIAPQEARAVLQKLAELKNYSQALDAGMSLWNLDRGIYKPT